MTPCERRFEDAERVIDASLTMRVISAAVGFVERAFEARRIPTLKGSACIVAAVAGVVTHALLLQLMPDRIAPVKPMAYWMVVAFAAFVVAAGFHTTRSSRTAMADKSAGTANARNS